MTVGRVSVQDLETKLRDCINQPRVHYALYSNDLGAFHVVCSSLDVIGDAAMAIEAYTHLEESDDFGLSYLRLYGLLQALYLQQDAARDIVGALKINCDTLTGDLSYVREIRNQAIGHPTRRDGSPKKNIPPSSHAIARTSLRLDSFLLMSYVEGKECETTSVSIPSLIEKQEHSIAQILLMAIEELQMREEEHRMKYKGQKLADIFNGPVGYYFEKLYAGCGGRERPEFISINIEMLNKILTSFREALTERGIIPAYTEIRCELDDAEYPLAELKKYNNGVSDNMLDERSSRIFVFFLEHQFARLSKLAESFDEDYVEETSRESLDNFSGKSGRAGV